jgi:hypothetical protein
MVRLHEHNAHERGENATANHFAADRSGRGAESAQQRQALRQRARRQPRLLLAVNPAAVLLLVVLVLVLVVVALAAASGRSLCMPRLLVP